MPLYDYEAADGTRVERFYRMGAAPPILVEDGVRYERRYDQMRINAFVPLGDYARPSTALPRWAEGFEHDDQGRCIIKNRKHEKEILRHEDGMEMARDVDIRPPETEYEARVKSEADKLIGKGHHG